MTSALRHMAYYKTGGEATAIFSPSSPDELADIVAKLHGEKSPYFLLGGGTNSLVMDEFYEGSVITFQNFAQLDIDQTTVLCGAGVENSKLVEAACAASLAGVGWMYRLPGQIGGTVRMNARCYGGEISQVVTKVHCVSKEGKVKHYDDPDVFRGYKDTLFMENGDLITGVEMSLTKGDVDEIRRKMEHCASDREGKGQFDFPSCGCVFKNDYSAGVPSGRLLDLAGVKDLQVGGAVISPQHANFVYNQGATSRDILELSLKMRAAVYEKFGVWLEYEMEMLGTLPEDLKKKVDEVRKANFNEAALKPVRDEFALKGKLKAAPEE